MLLPYKQNPCCKNQAYWRMVSLVRFAWRPRHASCQYYSQSRRGRRDKRGFPAWHQQFTPHSNHNLFSRIPTIYPVTAPKIYSAKRPFFASHGVLVMRFVHVSPSLGGDAETSEVSRHGTHNLFKKASLFRFAWRPRV